MGIELHVTEWMRGHVGMGATEYAAGEEQGKRENTTFAHEILIQMKDIDVFTTEPKHASKIDGHVEWLGKRYPFTDGDFHMLVASTDARVKHMFYRIPFVADGKPLTMLGHKELRDHAGLDLPADITTLFIQIYDGHVPGHDFERPNPVVPEWPPGAKAKGIIHIGLRDGVHSALSFRAPRATRVEKAGAVAKFLKFYAAGVYELYVRQSRNKLAMIAAVIVLAIAVVLVLLLR